jgi:hypothetical protein
MTIQILGSGCPTCKKLYEIVQKAVGEMELEDNVEYLIGVEGIQKIVNLGLMSGPVLTVNGKIAMVCFTSDINKIKSVITEASKE